MARPEIWAAGKARGGSIAAALCDRRATPRAAQRSAVFAIIGCLAFLFCFIRFAFLYAAEVIYEMASGTIPTRESPRADDMTVVEGDKLDKLGVRKKV
jgi:hypothetical protein